MSIPSSPRRSRIAHFKAPFILSVAGSAALGLGCGGKTEDLNRPNPPSLWQADAEDGAPPVLPTTALPCEGEPPISDSDGCSGPWRCVDGQWKVGQSCNPPPVRSTVCPTSPPDVGTSCGGYLNGYLGGLRCDYEYCYGATAPMRLCSESTGLWEEIPLPSCNPPPPTNVGCEATLPVPGSDCTVAELVCLHPPGCNGPNTAVCRSGQWVVSYTIGPACNPPVVIVPVCPEREIVTGEGCPYEGQECGAPVGCEPSAGPLEYVCSAGQWQAAVVSCPSAGNAPDAGATDGGS
jgi:hypothetical protein